MTPGMRILYRAGGWPEEARTKSCGTGYCYSGPFFPSAWRNSLCLKGLPSDRREKVYEARNHDYIFSKKRKARDDTSENE